MEQQSLQDDRVDRGDVANPVAPDVEVINQRIVNAYLVGAPGAPSGSWALIDAGMPGTAGAIRRAAAARFGADSRPAAIVMTHAHFDHVGALRQLAEEWDVPVYAHRLELPYLTGQASYPPPDPTVGGGSMPQVSRIFPRGPIDLGSRVRAFDDNRNIPGMPGWRVIHTPGHTPGHVSLFRDSDRVLIAGDAVITTKQESLTAVLAQRPMLHGPPAYFTPDWGKAGDSVRKLAAMEPLVLATGHGLPLHGSDVQLALHTLARDFHDLAVPDRGRYVGNPARFDETGIATFVPPAAPDPLPTVLAGLGLLVLAHAVVRHGRTRHQGLQDRASRRY